MAGKHLRHSKKSWNGFVERIGILADAGLEPQLKYRDAGAAAVDDVLDAVAAAWSAQRIARVEAATLPEDHDKTTPARQVIWY